MDCSVVRIVARLDGILFNESARSVTLQPCPRANDQGGWVADRLMQTMVFEVSKELKTCPSSLSVEAPPGKSEPKLS